jgi:hypothetical protein
MGKVITRQNQLMITLAASWSARVNWMKISADTFINYGSRTAESFQVIILV